MDVSVQTDLDTLNDESLEFAARPPPSRKKELLKNLDIKRLDTHALAAPKEVSGCRWMVGVVVMIVMMML